MNQMNRWISVVLALCLFMFGAAGLAESDDTESQKETVVENLVSEPDPAPASKPAEKQESPQKTQNENAAGSTAKEESAGENASTPTGSDGSGTESGTGTTGSGNEGANSGSSSGSEGGQNGGSQNEGGQNEDGQNEDGQNEGGQNEGGQNEGGQSEGGQNEGGQNEGGQNEGNQEDGEGNDGSMNPDASSGEGNEEEGSGSGSSGANEGGNNDSGENTDPDDPSGTDGEGNTGPDDDTNPDDPEDDPTDPTDDNETQDERFYIKNGVVLEYRGNDEDIHFPEDVTITAIGEGAFQGKNIKYVELPDTVETIEKGAFCNCPALEVVILPESVKTIKEKAFYNCPALQNVVVTSDNLFSIESEAFRECPSLPEAIQNQLKDVAENVADNAFDEREDHQQGDGTDGHTPSVIPSGGQRIPSNIQWATRSTSGGSTSTTVRRHSRSLVTTTHDYDQVLLTGDNSESMQTLTLGGEALELTLEGGGVFTVTLFDPENPDATPEEHTEYGDTLILTSETDGEWKLNGTVLRKLNKSGVETLVLQNGDQSSSVPTDGFLAGWFYDELKSMGTAGRRFEYSLQADANGLQWRVTVEGETYDLEDDPLAPIYLNGVVSLNGNREEQLAENTDLPETVSGDGNGDEQLAESTDLPGAISGKT